MAEEAAKTTAEEAKAKEDERKAVEEERDQSLSFLFDSEGDGEGWRVGSLLAQLFWT